MADILGISVGEYLVLSAETDELFRQIKESGDVLTFVSSGSPGAK